MIVALVLVVVASVFGVGAAFRAGYRAGVRDGFDEGNEHGAVSAAHAMIDVGLRPSPEQLDALRARVDELRAKFLAGEGEV